MRAVEGPPATSVEQPLSVLSLALNAIDSLVLDRLRVYGLVFLRDAAVVAAAYSGAFLFRFDEYASTPHYAEFGTVLPLVVAMYCLSLYRFGIHRRVWKFASMSDVRALADSSAVAGIAVGVLVLALGWRAFFPLTVTAVGTLFAFVGLLFVRVARRLTFLPAGITAKADRVLIVGAGQGGQIVAADLQGQTSLPEFPIGFIDDDSALFGRKIRGLPVFGTVEQLPDIVRDNHVDVVAVAIPSASTRDIDRIVGFALETEARVQMLPSQAEVVAGRIDSWTLRDINLDMLLERIPSHEGLQGALVQEFIRGKVVLVTGAAGSIGSELCRQLIGSQPAGVIALDNNETGLFHLEVELSSLPNGDLLTPVLTSVTAAPKLEQVFARYRPQVVFHAAAYKHVHMLERHVDEAVFVNVRGTQNVCRLAREYRSENVIFVSTDKAVRPKSALGFSKRAGELLTRAYQEDSDTTFCCVRFGNVLGSRGSALPEFISQIDNGGPVTVTHPDAERYFMTIPESVSLVIQAGSIAKGSEVFVLDMGKPIRIDDLAKRLIRLRGLRPDKDIEIQYTGLRPGEKLTEELSLHAADMRRTEVPGVMSVRERPAPALRSLTSQIESLVEIATSEESDIVLEHLESLALGKPAPTKLVSEVSAVSAS